MVRHAAAATLLVFGAALNGCDAGATHSPISTRTATAASSTATGSPTSTASTTRTATATVNSTATRTPTETSTTAARSTTPTASQTSTGTLTPTSTITRTSTPTSTPTVSPTQSGDSLTVFDSRSAFASAAGALLTDDYEDPGYAEFQDDASMNAVKELTRYKTTFFPDFDEVIATPNGHIYAGGFTSGSFQLDFTAPSLGGSGVHAIGFDFANNIPMPYVAFVSFADGTSQNFPLHSSSFQILSPPPNFFGLTSAIEITRINIGLMDGGVTSDNLFAIDNLSVAAPPRAVFTGTRTATPSLTPTSSPPPRPIDEAALAASARVATEPLFRLLDFQARLGAPGGVAGRSIVYGCQQFDCVVSGQVTGSEEDCCLGARFTQVFDECRFHDDLGRVVGLNGVFTLDSDDVDVCTGTIPVGARFSATLNELTHDVVSPDGAFSRTFQQLTETFEIAPGGCTVLPEQSGLGIRGDGRRVIDGELQQFQSDGAGHILVDSESDIHALEIAVSSTQGTDGCTVAAALNGSLTSVDLRSGSQFRTDFTDLHVVQPPSADALLFELNGTIGTDCLGDVTLSTVEPLRVASGEACFTSGRLEAQLENGAVSATFADGGLDLDLGADGNVDRHFAACADLPADSCLTTTVGLCGACTAVEQCQGGLSCFPCSRDCTGNAKRCSLSDEFVACEDGVF